MERGSCEMSSEGEGIGLGGPLGNNLRNHSTPPEIIDKSEGILRRLERYRMQSVARRVIPTQRVAKCLRQVRPKRDRVEVYKGKEKAYYSGLIVCGSIWICPVCAAKISETRRKELQAGIASWRNQGGTVVMLTQTVPHYEHQSLKEVLEKFSRSRLLFRNRKTFKAIASEIGLAGSVRALEVTHGGNGWHVHAHELLCLKNDVSAGLQGIEERMLQMWKGACVSAGLDEPDHHGLKVHDGSYASSYAGKWGLEHEVTKAHLKKGRDNNLTPWDLLRQAGSKDFDQVEAAVKLFIEYSKAFKGKRQLVWSDGMRKLLGLEVEASDEDLAGEVEDGALLLGSLTKGQWRIVLHADRRGELLEVAASSGWRGVLDYIQILIERE